MCATNAKWHDHFKPASYKSLYRIHVAFLTVIAPVDWSSWFKAECRDLICKCLPSIPVKYPRCKTRSSTLSFNSLMAGKFL